MRLSGIATAVLFASTAICSEEESPTKPLTSRVHLPSNFKPPQVFKNVNLVHILNLERGYPRELVNVVIENTSEELQDEYFIPFTSQQMETIGGLEVKDKKNADDGLFDVKAVEYDTQRYY
jgi:oligosaccharyltransferase complex subunit alpha (ribophorin I)